MINQDYIYGEYFRAALLGLENIKKNNRAWLSAQDMAGGFRIMPLYEYECTTCGKTIEAVQKFSDKPLTKCEFCSGKLHKLISQSSFHLKGTGWYVTDYAGKKPSDSRNADESKPAKKIEKKAEKKKDSPVT